MKPIRPLLAALLSVLLVPLAHAESAPPADEAQGDLSQVGDVGPAPTDVGQLLSMDLTDREAARFFERAMATILVEYQGSDVSEADLYVGALVGMVELLNAREHSQSPNPASKSRNAVMTTSDAAYIEQMTQGRKTGIGIEFQANTAEGVLYITKVYPGSPAERSGGLRPGDLIVAIDGYALQRRDLAEILTLLRGDAGTPIGLSLRRPPAGYFNVVLTREEYQLPSVDVHMLDEQLGMMRVNQFHGRTGAEARARLAELVDLGASSMVLDLRGNQGGLLSAVLARRIDISIERGKAFGAWRRVALAVGGGILVGYASALASGCTSGQALSGGALLANGSIVFMLCVFGGGYAAAYFVRKQWHD